MWEKTILKVVLVIKWKNLGFSKSKFIFLLVPAQDWLGQHFMQPKKYLKITRYVGIYLKLMSRGIQNLYDFLP